MSFQQRKKDEGGFTGFSVGPNSSLKARWNLAGKCRLWLSLVRPQGFYFLFLEEKLHP